ncbi:MAG TPA: phosphate ABC transporter ATP-binding protein [candidate division WOR-3 bacterium]|uniref:Phosphate ABC transporter ATP-binding protein n=1 Tax=candidate division WOR-3 bacterium TaxID=2052148 RepID=A0A9C9EKV0_UNCW3|nr:phosphate ABC transporter ATP-binding protein [candidate division WOR-3 bacterium]
MIIETANLNLYYGKFQALKNINLSIRENLITGIIGPSGCGKSTLLRVFNRMNDLIKDVKITGSVRIDGEDIYSPVCDLIMLRKKVGMVFQRPNAFPLSVFDNVAYGPRVWGITDKRTLNEIVERSLRAVDLFEDLKDRLKHPALNLSAEKQQRLCIARLLAVEPHILLMDEPCSALDPIATSKIEELMLELKKKYTIIIVTHNMQQAARIADEVGFMLLGEMIEFDKAKKIFTNPEDKRTFDYISGRFG